MPEPLNPAAGPTPAATLPHRMNPADSLRIAAFAKCGIDPETARRAVTDNPKARDEVNRCPTDYTQARAGDGNAGPFVDVWRTWKHSKPMTREEVIDMAAAKYLREAGFAGGHFEKPHTFTVWHYREGDPCHPNGRPMTVHAVTMIAHPNHRTA